MALLCLIDANILIYTFDRTEPVRQGRASRVLGELRTQGAGAVSTQTLGECFNVTTRGVRDPLTRLQACEQIIGFAGAFAVLEVTLPIVLQAARASAEHDMSYWDAQVWATAKLNRIPYVLSEDLQGWQSLEGVTFVNPLLDEFDLASLTR